MQLTRRKTQEVGNSFMVNCEDRRLSPKTLEGYALHIRRLVQISPKFPPKPEAIRYLLASVKGGVHNVDSHWRTFHALGNFAKKKYRIPNFMEDVPRPKIPRQIMPTITEDELARLAMFLQKAPLRDKAIVALFIDTGIRKGEAVNLKRRDILEDRIIIHGKTGYREAPISPITRDFLLSLPVHKDGYVFHGTGRYKDNPLGLTGFYKIVKHYLLMASYSAGKQFGPQILRRSLGRFWLLSGGDSKSLSLVLGHTSEQTTIKYYAPLLANDVVQIHHKRTPGKVFEDVSKQRLQEWVIIPSKKVGALVP